MSDIQETKATPKLDDVLPRLLSAGCPCRFPRFIYLVGFNFKDYKTGPVCCRDTEELVHKSYYGPAAFLDQHSERVILDSTHRDYQCRACGAKWEFVFTDYSISMSRSYLRLHSRVLPDIGADLALPFPIVGGFSGFKQRDIETCAQSFRQALMEECFNYLIKTK